MLRPFALLALLAWAAPDPTKQAVDRECEQAYWVRRAKQHQQALAKLTECLSRGPSAEWRLRAALEVGDIMLIAGRRRQAERHFRAALAEDPRSMPGLVGLAGAARLGGDYEASLELCAQAAASVPVRRRGRRAPPPLEPDACQIETLIWAGRTAEALERLDEFDRRHGVHAILLSLRSAALLREGRLAQAEEAARLAVESDPGEPRAALALGAALRRRRPDHEAESYLRRADRGLDPEQRLELGLALQAAGKGEEAARVLREGLELARLAEVREKSRVALVEAGERALARLASAR